MTKLTLGALGLNCTRVRASTLHLPLPSVPLDIRRPLGHIADQLRPLYCYALQIVGRLAQQIAIMLQVRPDGPERGAGYGVGNGHK